MTARLLLPLALVTIVIASQLGTSISREHGSTVGGEPRVIDGDTLQLGGNIVQLYGIDAPELGQLCETDGSLWACGVEAALALRKLVTFGGHQLHCSPWANSPGERTAHGGTVEVCEVSHEDVALVMLHNGYGVALPGSFPDYLDAQEQARQARLGIWHSNFVSPWIWRAGTAGQRTASVRQCNVKGTLGADGQRLYYVPTDPEYQDIAIHPDRGEHMFCSDEEARLAGWTRSGEEVGSE